MPAKESTFAAVSKNLAPCLFAARFFYFIIDDRLERFRRGLKERAMPLTGHLTIAGNWLNKRLNLSVLIRLHTRLLASMLCLCHCVM